MRNLISPSAPNDTAAAAVPLPRKRVLWLACMAHALHDGYTDMMYVLLPVWQMDFGLSYGALATLRGIYAGTMAGLQLPAGRLAGRFGSRATLALGTGLAALGYAAAGMSGSLAGLCAALAVSGIGSSTQHPLASGAVSRVYGGAAREPLSLYNFAGDLGKSALPAAVSLLVTVMPWRHALWLMAAVGVIAAAALMVFFPALPRAPRAVAGTPAQGQAAAGRGFWLLFSIGVLDTGVRMGLLTFLPFLLKAKGIAAPMIGTALALVFIGGAAGKFACGWIGARLGIVRTVLLTEGGTAACILVVMILPLTPSLVLLPLLGLMLNGTSSVLYGTVPDLVPYDGVERAFALFYTGTIGSGALAPILYGLLGDHVGVHAATVATALTALATVPLALVLGPRLAARRAVAG
jgi:FSR family fosmidomycin resistance protein-like MFS transporter